MRLIQDAVASDAAGLGGTGAIPPQQRAHLEASTASHSLELRGGSGCRRTKDPPPSSRHTSRLQGSEADQRDAYKGLRRSGKEQPQKSAAEQAAGRAKHTSFNNHGGHQVERASLGRLPQSARWVAPAVVLLVALFAQNAGLYLGTRCYVKWMDELQRPSPSGAVTGSSGSANVLLDVASVLPLPGHSLELLTHVLDAATSLVPVLWFCLVTRTRDLRLWTQVMLSCALLALLKGFFAWSTVMPDAEGWEACRERLDKDGLKYYRRQLFGSSSSIDAREIDLPKALLDILLLEVRGLWLLGMERRGRFCGDSLFSSALCRAVLFSLSLWEAVRASSWKLQARTRFIVRTAARCILGAVILGNTVLPVLNRYHYSADVLLALLLALLVYSNPAIAIAVQRWAQGDPGAVAEGSLPLSQRDALAAGARPSSAAGSAAVVLEPTPGLEDLPEEEGRVALSHYCFGPPVATPDGFVFLRAGAVQLPSEEIGPEVRQMQLEHLRSVKAQLLRCRRLKEEQIVQVHAEAQMRAAQAAEEANRRLEERLTQQAQELELEERRLMGEAASRAGEDSFDLHEQATPGASAARCTAGCLM